jgi:hypothetical protein
MAPYTFTFGEIGVKLPSAAGVIGRPSALPVNGADFLLRWNASGNLQFFINSTLVVTHPFTFAIGTWYRIAVSRVSGTVYLLINGVLEDSGLNSGNISSTNPVRLAGYPPTNSDFFNGHIDEFRATKGVGRYTANYTVDSEEFLDF